MKPRFRIEKRAGGWCIAGLGGRTVYWSSDYAKVVGVHDFITEWGGFRSVYKAEDAETAPNAPPTPEHGNAGCS